MAEVEVRGDLLGLGGGERAGAHGVAPATVADSSADEVHLSTQRVLVDLLHHHGDVDTGVGLSGDVELVGLVLREAIEEVHQELVGILSGGFISVHALTGLGSSLAVRKSDTFGGFEVNHVGHAAPCVGVIEHLGNTVDLISQRIIVGDNLSILSQKADQGRRSRSAVQPQHNGVGCGIVGGLDEPVVQLTLTARKVSGGEI